MSAPNPTTAKDQYLAEIEENRHLPPAERYEMAMAALKKYLNTPEGQAEQASGMVYWQEQMRRAAEEQMRKSI